MKFVVAFLITLLLLQAFSEAAAFTGKSSPNEVDSQGNNKEAAAAIRKKIYPVRINCAYACSRRCSKTSRKNVCTRACRACCATCNCVPPGTYGNKAACPCYAKLRTHGNRPKCP